MCKNNDRLTIRDRDLPIPINRPTPDTQEKNQNDNVTEQGIGCDVFDCTMVSRQSLTRTSNC